MLFLLSPAKSLDYESPVPDLPHTEPSFVPQSAELIGLLKTQWPQQIASLMDLSDKLLKLKPEGMETEEWEKLKKLK
mgnify:CR=1 FL=1